MLNTHACILWDKLWQIFTWEDTQPPPSLLIGRCDGLDGIKGGETIHEFPLV